MSLSKKQRRFTLAVGKLIDYAYDRGYELTFGDAMRDPRVHGDFGEPGGYGSKRSVHKLRLAVDFNLFVEGKYIRSSVHSAWSDLHDYWESLGGAERIKGDENHFSFEHWGSR